LLHWSETGVRQPVQSRRLLRVLAIASLPTILWGHAAPVPTPKAPYRVQNSVLIDAESNQFLLNGVQMLGLSYADPDEAQAASVRALNSLTFRVIRQRWNLNTVRLIINPAIWERDGQVYLDRISETVRVANAENLVVNLASSGGALPGPEVTAFWSALASMLRESPMVVFSVYTRPSLPNAGEPRGREHWDLWRNGMQTLVDAIRSTGAQQLIAVSAFDDAQGFRCLDADLLISDPNVMYEIYPSFDPTLIETEWDKTYGFVGSRFPLYAGDWGVRFDEESPACRAFPGDPSAATESFYGLVYHLGIKAVSWSAASFEPAQLVRDFERFEPTLLDRPWRCGERMDPQPGIGGLLMLWLTGDPFGFGSIAPDQIASAAGGPSGAVAPGQVINIYGQLVGPELEAEGTVDEATGRLSTTVAETQVLFDEIAAPVLSAGYFVVKVQVPFELAGKSSTRLIASYRGVVSNQITLALTDVAPGIFTKPGSITDALATNQNESQNSDSNPAGAGSVVTLLVTGYGQTAPVGTTGRPARAPLAKPLLPIALTIGGIETEVVESSEATGMVGVMRVLARVPLIPGSGLRTVPVVLSVGARRSRPDVRIWVR
jgi:uncharacterized protein (TIGR03437 family)